MKYGLIGEKLGHSYSEIIHRKIGDYGYVLNPVAKEDLHSFMTKGEFCGINVTIPYKREVIPYLYKISDEAKAIGSVNTVVNREGKLYGYNTDYAGFLSMADKAGISFFGKKVIILGSGGTSLTAKAVAQNCGASEIVVVSRSGENNYGNIELHKDCDVLINTTPVGMYPNNGVSPVNLSTFDKLEGVIDVIYNPLRTELLIQAENMGIKNTGGLPMLVSQAVFAYEHFFDTNTPEDFADKIYDEVLSEMENIVLIGMPGCGKTTIGTLLSEKLNRDILDTDQYIFHKTTMTAEDIIKKHGEPEFRRIEAETAEELGRLSGKIISTGGGIVLNPLNMKNFHRNGKIIYIDRDVDKLDRKGRPLSFDHSAVLRLYEQRIGLYRKYSDFTVSNNTIPEDTAKEILQNCYKG